MEWLFLIFPLAVGFWLLFLAGIWCAQLGHGYLAAAMSALEDGLQRTTARATERHERRAERTKAERRFAMAAGFDGDVDHDAVEAARQMPVIRHVIDGVLPDAIARCVRVHRLAAHAAGARYIREIAREPECAGLRYRVVGLAEAAVAAIERYPLLVEDETLMSNLIVLRSRIVPICRACPYVEHAVAKAPLLCPTAIIARIDPDRCRDVSKES